MFSVALYEPVVSYDDCFDHQKTFSFLFCLFHSTTPAIDTRARYFYLFLHDGKNAEAIRHFGRGRHPRLVVHRRLGSS
jgi:hypothetical protein